MSEHQQVSRRALLAGAAAALASAGGLAAWRRADSPDAATVDGARDAPGTPRTTRPTPGSSEPERTAEPREPSETSTRAPDEPVPDAESEADPTTPADTDPAEDTPADRGADELGGADGEDPELPGVDAARVQPICRDAWGAVAAAGAFRAHTPSRLTLHHTAVVLGDNAAAPSRLRGHQAFHQDQGWPDLAYHYAVDRDGNAYEGRPVDAAGDTFTDYDPAGHFLVVCEGDFSREQPTEAMLDTVAGLFAWGADWFGIDPDTLGGHRDHASTTCPGDNLYAVLADGSLRARIEDRLGVGVRLDVICGDDGRAAVAAIEA